MKMVNLKILLFVIFSLIGKINLNASPQIPDYIIFKNDTFPIYTFILEEYLNNQQNQVSLFGFTFRENASINCWRGYQAIYELTNDSLFLNQIISCGEFDSNNINEEESQYRLKTLFKNQVKNNKVFVNWYSGKFSIPKGDILRWDGIFYASFEKELIVNVESGIIEQKKEVENYVDYPDRINRRFNDTISNVIYDKLKDLDWEKMNEYEYTCTDEYFITINPYGEINDVSRLMPFHFDNDTCIKCIHNALKSLKFDIIKQEGVEISEQIYIWIIYEGKTGKLKIKIGTENYR